MFLDSKIPGVFTCDKTKCSYFLCHGVDPDVKNILLSAVSAVHSLVELYDKSFSYVRKNS